MRKMGRHVIVTEEPRSTPVRKRKGRIVLWGAIALCVLVGIGMFSVLGREVTAPEWVRERVVDRIAELVPGADIDVADMRVAFEDSRPVVRFRDLTLLQADGTPLVRLADAEVELSTRQLLSGNLRARRVALNSAQLNVRRAVDGSFDLKIGDAQTSVSQSEDMLGLLDGLKTTLQQPQFNMLREVSADNLTLRYADARANLAWTVDGGRMTLTNDDNHIDLSGDFALLGARDYATTLAVSYKSSFTSQAAELGMVLEDLSAKETAALFPAFAWAEVLDAPISGAFRGAVDENGQLGVLSATLEIGKGALRPTQDVRPIAFSSAKTYLTYDPSSQSIDFSEISLISDWVTATASGRAYLQEFNQGWPETLVAQLQLSQLTANPSEVYEAPISFDEGVVDLRLKFDPFTLDIGQAAFLSQGQRLSASGQVTASDLGWGVSVDASADAIDRTRILALWPADIKPLTRRWVSENLTSATVHDLTASLRAPEGERIDLTVGFEFADAVVRYLKTMPVVEKAAGYGLFRDNMLSIALEQGTVLPSIGGAISVAGSSLRIDDVRIKGGPLDLDLRTDSTVTALLSVLDQKPFEFLTKAGRTPTLADGRFLGNADIQVPLRKGILPKDVNFVVSGKAVNVRSSSLVPGRVLAASALDVTVDNTGITIGGRARVGAVPLDGTWRLDFSPETRGQSRVDAQIELSEQFIDEFQITLPPGSVSGAGKAQLTIDLIAEQSPEFSLISDLNRIAIELAPLAWSKSAATRGRLEVLGTLGKVPEITKFALSGPDLSLEGRLTFTDTGGLSLAYFSGVSVGDWFAGEAVLTGQGKGVPPSVEITGGTLDLRDLPRFAPASRSAQSSKMRVFLDTVRVTDTMALESVQADVGTQGGLNGQFTGLFNGGPLVEGVLRPSTHGTTVAVRIEQGAAALRSMDLLRGARGGSTTLQLVPTASTGVYNGEMRMRDLRITDAPTLAEILGAISVVGLLEQLSGQGLVFNEVDASFQLSPDRLAITQASAVGPSMGIAIDGLYFPKQKQIDVQGVLSPIYILNGIGSFLTRKGEGLIGFNFRIKGPVDDPKVFVNPLSALTPGMFREIFRKPPPRLSQ